MRSKLFKYVKDLSVTDKVWTIDGKIMCTKKLAPGVSLPAQQRPVVIESPDDLFKLGVVSVDWVRLGLLHLKEDDADV